MIAIRKSESAPGRKAPPRPVFKAKLVSTNSLLNVNFEDAKGRLMSLNGHLQSVQHPFGGVEIRDNSLRNRNRCIRNANRLRIKTEIDDEFFRCSGYPAEVGIGRHDFRVVDLDRCPLLGFGSGVLFGSGIFLGFRHGLLLLR